jgi:hypothetical protein
MKAPERNDPQTFTEEFISHKMSVLIIKKHIVLSQVYYFRIVDFEILGLTSKTQSPVQLRNPEIPKSAIGKRHFTIAMTLVLNRMLNLKFLYGAYSIQCFQFSSYKSKW